MRVGLIGCGAIARRAHIPALQASGATLTAFASRTIESARAAAAEAGGGDAMADWRELVARDDVDAVVISTPNALHAPQALAAIEAGKHVLVEKPFTITVAEADAVIEAAGRAGVVAMAAHNARFAPPVAALQAAVADIGPLTAVRAVFAHGGPTQWSAASGWFFEHALSGGGALIDLGVHLVDTLRFLTGDEVTAVACTLGSVVDGVERDAVAALRFESGAVGTLHAGWGSAAGQEVALTLQGTSGNLVLDAGGARLLRSAAEPVALGLRDVGTAQDAFVRAVAAGRAESPTAADGRAAVAVVQACYQSAAEGRWVSL